jgi:hypothetical protein
MPNASQNARHRDWIPPNRLLAESSYEVIASTLFDRFRPVAAVGALTAAALVALTAASDRRDRDRLVTKAVELGLRGTPFVEAATAIRREHDAGERRLALARALFVARPVAPGDTLAERIARLDTAESLAVETLELLPASWEASSLLGASRFESRRLRRDTRLFTAASDWERPLLAAVSRASGSPIVEHQLATAYIEVWPAMAESRRFQASTLLRRMFEDRRFFVRKVARWVEVNRSYEEAAELLPQDVATASRLVELAYSRGQAQEVVRWSWETRGRLAKELESGIEHARSDGGAWTGPYLMSVVGRAPVGVDFARLIDRAVPGIRSDTSGLGYTEAAAKWLQWAEPLCLVKDCPLAPHTITTLLTAAAAHVGSPSAAFARLAAGKPVSAEQLAQRAGGAWSEDWASYFLLRAKNSLASGDLAAARSALSNVHPNATRRPMYLDLARRCGITPPPAGALAREVWDNSDWRRDDRLLELELGLGSAAQGLHLAFRRPVRKPFLLEVELDGNLEQLLWVEAGARGLEIPLALEPGIAYLRLRTARRDPFDPLRIALD